MEHRSSRPASLSVVVPAYNEAAGLTELHRRVSAAARAAAGDDYEIVIINDGSSDDSWARIGALAAADAHLVGVNLSRNHGHQLALTAGLSLCRGERVLIIDADLQDPPELLADMMALMDEGAEVVYAVRRRRTSESAFKKTTAYLFYRLLAYLAETDIPKDAGDFRLISRKALDVLNAMPEQQRYIRGMVSWIGMRQVPIVYDRQARHAGTSHYPLRKMIRFALDALMSFSTRPLRIASYFGLVLGFVGFVGLVYVLGSWFLSLPVSGWTSLAVMVLLLGSVQLVVLGIIGEYLGRMFVEMKRRPLFIVSEIVGQGTDGAPAAPRRAGPAPRRSRVREET